MSCPCWDMNANQFWANPKVSFIVLKVIPCGICGVTRFFGLWTKPPNSRWGGRTLAKTWQCHSWSWWWDKYIEAVLNEGQPWNQKETRTTSILQCHIILCWPCLAKGVGTCMIIFMYRCLWLHHPYCVHLRNLWHTRDVSPLMTWPWWSVQSCRLLNLVESRLLWESLSSTDSQRISYIEAN